MAERRNIAAIVRHGEYHQRAGAPSARQPYALTDLGLSQARACGDELADALWAQDVALNPVIHCSRQLRAWQTASQIADRLRAHGHIVAEIREDSALAERGLGSAANLTVAEIEQVIAADPRHAPLPAGWKSDSYYTLPLEGAESLMQAGQRVANILRDVMQARQTGGMTIFVGHGASFRHAAYHLGVLQRAQIAQLSMFHARPLQFCYSPHDNWSHFAGDWKVRPEKQEPLD